MIVLIGIGLLAGVITAISPCVLPVLPILLAGGVSGRKPLRIIAGLVVSFVVFTLFSAWLLNELGLPDDLLRNIAIALLFVVAATLLVPQLAIALERPFARLTRFRAGGGGFILGASLGLVFVPCAGPVLATISVVAATNAVGLRAILLTIAYAIGAAIPMLAIAFGGRKLADPLRAHAAAVRYTSGLVIGVFALGIALNWFTGLQTSLPGYTAALQKHVEQTSTAKKALDKVHHTKTLVGKPAPAGSTLENYGAAPAIHAGGDWFNSKPLTLKQLRGKVVLIDFWTYTCINCLRTLPHVKAWYAAYHKDGFEVIGVHTPEFAFEHVSSNVRAAIKRLGITYPVVQDNNYATWNAYSNQYWPAEYLIDQNGDIRHVSFGEGDYSETEGAIRMLLGITHGSMTDVPNETPTEMTTPESYLGFTRLTRYAGSKLHPNAFAQYSFPKAALGENELALQGKWNLQSQRIVSGKGASLRLHFHADDVYLVLGGRGKVGVSVDGKPTSTIDVDSYRLYTLQTSTHVKDALLQLDFTPGVQAYDFTFG